ncbi:hypothetical protein [Niallia sp. Man26]|nr:hypothetical protein [Niallia sp. Man26]UPO91372.1 hypothetical protein L8T27_028075 [Niallia sp. Man26]
MLFMMKSHGGHKDKVNNK